MIAFVTGADKGIGRQIASQLADLGHTVVIGARSPEAGEKAAAELRADGHDAASVVLDVTDPASVAAAAETTRSRYGRLDALINDAGISVQPGADFSGQLASTADVDNVRFVFETNVFALITVTSAFLPLLRASAAPRIVDVTSAAGSLTSMSDPALADQHPVALGYVPSKSAATALTVQYARDLAGENILVNAVDPGFVATDLTGFRGTGTAAQGAVAAVAMATISADGPTGTFTDDQGPVPW